MRKILFAIIILSYLSSCAVFRPNQTDPETVNHIQNKLYSPKELNEDFNRFRKILEEKTAGLYTDRVELSRRLEKAEAALTKPMTELEFYRLLTPSMAALRCGHSFLSVSETMETHMRLNAAFFPLSVRFIDSRIYVIADPRNTGIAPGSEILSINGNRADEIIGEITLRLSTDGEDTGRPRYDGERWFAAFYYSFIDTSDTFDVVISSSKTGEPLKKTLRGVSDSSLAKTAQGVIFDTINAPYSHRFHSDYAVLTIPCFIYSDFGAYKSFLRDFFTELSRRETETLIVDLRGNYGGTPKPTVELFKYLIDTPLPFFGEDNIFYLGRYKKPIDPEENHFQGNLYLLMDEAGFSMNSFLLSLLKYNDIGTLVGAQSAGGWKCSDAARNAVLPRTGLRLRYSTGVFSTAVEGMEPGWGIEPDLEVSWSLDHYTENRDPVMAAALEKAGL